MTKPLFVNFYRCNDCGIEWIDKWVSSCDDECPDCFREHEAMYSDLVNIGEKIEKRVIGAYGNTRSIIICRFHDDSIRDRITNIM